MVINNLGRVEYENLASTNDGDIVAAAFSDGSVVIAVEGDDDLEPRLPSSWSELVDLCSQVLHNSFRSPELSRILSGNLLSDMRNFNDWLPSSIGNHRNPRQERAWLALAERFKKEDDDIEEQASSDLSRISLGGGYALRELKDGGFELLDANGRVSQDNRISVSQLVTLIFSVLSDQRTKEVSPSHFAPFLSVPLAKLIVDGVKAPEVKPVQPLPAPAKATPTPPLALASFSGVKSHDAWFEGAKSGIEEILRANRMYDDKLKLDK